MPLLKLRPHPEEAPPPSCDLVHAGYLTDYQDQNHSNEYFYSSTSPPPQISRCDQSSLSIYSNQYSVIKILSVLSYWNTQSTQ